MKKLVKLLCRNLSKVRYFILNFISKKIACLSIYYDITQQEKYSNYYYSFKLKPKKEANIFLSSDFRKDYSNIAIILQGPVVEKDNFTLETIKYYRKMYPTITIILSTWKNINLTLKNQLVELAVKIVENDPPEKSGSGNINFQTTSTINGILNASDGKVKYVLKTRTDQRIYKPLFIEYFLSLITSFKPKENYLQQKLRIVVLSGSVGATMFIPYFVSDFMFFGHIEDIKNYFSIELDSKLNFKNKDEQHKYFRKYIENNPNSTILDCYKIFAPEVIYFQAYIDKFRTYKTKETIEDFWEIIKNSFVCISPVDLELLWFKERHLNESTLFQSFDEKDNEKKLLSYNFDFQRWLSLYQNMIEYNPIYENYCKMKYTEYSSWRK